MAIVELKDVTVQFNTSKVLDSISLEISPEDSLSLIGPNGAGKTTLLKVVAGLLTPTIGEVRFKGRIARAEALDNLRCHTTMVFQKPVLFGTTVYKNVAYGLRVRGLPEGEVFEKTMNALKLVQMEKFAERQARSLSGGEQKRVTLAMGVAIEPQVLLLDEPTSYLDSTGVKIVEKFIQTVGKQRQTAVIVATHDLVRAIRMTEDAIIIEEGRLGERGPSSQVIREELETIAFGERDTNIFHGIAENSTAERKRHLAQIRLERTLVIKALTHMAGEVLVRIPPEDIVVSREPVLSSAKNTLRGEVKTIERDESTVKLTVDVGIDLVAVITKSSLDTLGVSVGDLVYVTFKASSVRVY